MIYQEKMPGFTNQGRAFYKLEDSVFCLNEKEKNKIKVLENNHIIQSIGNGVWKGGKIITHEIYYYEVYKNFELVGYSDKPPA